MSKTANDYKGQLIKLQPQGMAWPTEDTANWVQLLTALAQELARVDTRADNLLSEAIPSQTTELLTSWESEYGLPDPCSGLGASITIRKKDLLAKYTARGGATPQYFVDVAAALGYTVTITEFDAFRIGTGAIGDNLNDGAWQYAWQVNSSLNTVSYFQAGNSGAGDALASWGNERLECVISARKPAHTIVLFAYS